MKKIAVLSIIIVALAFNSFAQNADDLAETKAVSISGVVLSKSSNELLPNVTISVKKYSTDIIEFRDAQKYILKTNSNGRWGLKGLEAGEYYIVITPNERKGGRLNSRTRLAQVTKIVDIQNDLENFTVKIPNESVISGRIIVKDGSASDAGEVFIIATDAEKKIDSGADVKGTSFSLVNLSEGSYKLNLNSENGYFVERISLNGEDISNSAIELKDGQAVKNIHILLSKESGYLVGNVIGLNASGGVMVFVMPVKDTAEESLRGSIPDFPDENGKFKFTISPGEYFVSTIKTTDLDKKTENKKEWFEFLTKNAQKVFVVPTQTTNVEINFKN